MAAKDTGKPNVSTASLVGPEAAGYLTLAEASRRLTYEDPPVLESPNDFFDRIEAEAKKGK